ncbi:MAG: fibronectin type III domain-containing protein [Micrococcales bacterium]
MRSLSRLLGALASTAVLLASTLFANPATAAINELPNTPNKPTFSNVTTDAFTINWTIPAGGNIWIKWVVEFSADGVSWPISGRQVCSGASQDVCGTSTRITDVPEDSLLYVRVALANLSSQAACAGCEPGYSNWSQVASVRTLNTYTTTPTYLRVKGTPGPYNFAVQWTEPHFRPTFDILQYDVQYRKFGSSSWIDAGGDDLPFFTFQYYMRLGTKYQVRVRAQYLDAAGYARIGAWSNIATITTARSGPPSYILDGTTKVTKKTYDALSGNTYLTVRFKWDAPLDNGGAPVTRYEFRTRAANSADWQNTYNTGMSRTLTIPGFNCHVDPVTGPKYYHVFLAINAYNAYGTLEYNSAQIGIYTDSPKNIDRKRKQDKRCTVTQIY